MTTVNLPCSFLTDPVHVFFFTEVLNAAELRERLLSGDQEYLYAFLEGDLILSHLQVLAAVNRAVHDQHYGLMRTKHLHSEIVYALAGTQNITEAFKTFGLTDSTKNVIVVKVAPNAEEVAGHVRTIVKGKEIPFNDPNLSSMANFAKIRKYYKLGANNAKRKAQGEENRWNDQSECTKVILGTIALRGSN